MTLSCNLRRSGGASRAAWAKRREVHLRLIDPMRLHEGKYSEGGTNSFAARVEQVRWKRASEIQVDFLECAFEREALAGPSMVRFLFRFAGLVLIALSFLFVVYDGTKSIADQTIYISRVGPTWVNIHPNSLSAFEPAVQTLAGAWVWSDVIQPYFLEQPTALVLGIIGALLVLLGSKKKPRTGW